MTDKDSPIRQNDWLQTRIFLHDMNIYSKRGITQFLHFDIAILDIQCNAAMPEQLNIKYFGIFVITRF